MQEQEMRSRQESRRAAREEMRRSKRRKYIIVASCLVLALLLAGILLGPWGPFGKVLFGESEKKTDEPVVRKGTDQKEKGEEGEEEAESSTLPQNQQATAPTAPAAPVLIAPMDGAPKYPFTRDGSVACGHWPQGSLDYPYFGAPRERTRIHAGIDIYPPSSVGTPVKAVKAGRVIKVDIFYTRATGENTYGVLIDHGDFVANYAELKPPSVKVGDTVGQGTLLGVISGTEQLHLEMYTPGTTNWLQWYGNQPANLLDPTATMLQLYGL